MLFGRHSVISYLCHILCLQLQGITLIEIPTYTHINYEKTLIKHIWLLHYYFTHNRGILFSGSLV